MLHYRNNTTLTDSIYSIFKDVTLQVHFMVVARFQLGNWSQTIKQPLTPW